jgi:hypothetical protein
VTRYRDIGTLTTGARLALACLVGSSVGLAIGLALWGWPS